MFLLKCPLSSDNLSIPNKTRDSSIIMTPRLLVHPHRYHGDILRIIWEMDLLHPSAKRVPLRSPRKPVGIRVLSPNERCPVRLDRGVQFGSLPGRNVPDGIHGCSVHGPHSGLDVGGRDDVPATSC